mmetsp:Transcript_14704/g.32003  ORF Transcript_14704/g.32003 Transcript_14704/m.32003 type:complete len:351 (-) Transcript_14704:719-1771(-)
MFSILLEGGRDRGGYLAEGVHRRGEVGRLHHLRLGRRARVEEVAPQPAREAQQEHFRRRKFDQVPHQEQIVDQIRQYRPELGRPSLLPPPAAPHHHLRRELVAHGDAPVQSRRVVRLGGQLLLAVLLLLLAVLVVGVRVALLGGSVLVGLVRHDDARLHQQEGQRGDGLDVVVIPRRRGLLPLDPSRALLDQVRPQRSLRRRELEHQRKQVLDDDGPMAGIPAERGRYQVHGRDLHQARQRPGVGAHGRGRVDGQRRQRRGAQREEEPVVHLVRDDERLGPLHHRAERSHRREYGEVHGLEGLGHGPLVGGHGLGSLGRLGRLGLLGLGREILLLVVVVFRGSGRGDLHP